MYQNLFDSHTHSENSLDAVHSVTFMAEIAYDRGVQGISVTDHCDCDRFAQYDACIRQKQSELDVVKTRVAFQGHVLLTHGMELGNPHYDYEGARAVLDSQRFDFVLLALHRMREWEDFHDVDYSKFTQSELCDMMRRYFVEMLEIVRWGEFDSLAHLSLPLRYLAAYHHIFLDLHAYADEIDAVLKALAQGGKAMEINTSGLRGALAQTLPPAWVIRRFRECGGEIVTIGSDSHSAHDIGAGVQSAMCLLAEAGFGYFAFYRDRKPVMLRII